MKNTGWKKIPNVNSDAGAIEQLNRAAQALSEAQSRLYAVRFSSRNMSDKYALVADKMFCEIKKAERTYHNARVSGNAWVSS